MQRYIILITTCVCLLFWGGCGIDIIPVLESPVYILASVASSTFVFDSSGTEGIEAFLGYDIYYKLYDDESTIEPDNFNSAGTALVTNLSSLNYKGFRPLRRIQNANLNSTPFIEVSTSAGTFIEARSRYTIDFFPLEQANLSSVAIDAGGLVLSNVLLYRNVWDTDNGVNKDFTDILVADSDFYNKNSGGDIYISLYVVSYGVYELSTAIYGTPVWLHYVKLPTN